MHDDFDLIVKAQEESATITEVEKALNLRFKHVKDKVTSVFPARIRLIRLSRISIVVLSAL